MRGGAQRGLPQQKAVCAEYLKGPDGQGKKIREEQSL